MWLDKWVLVHVEGVSFLVEASAAEHCVAVAVKSPLELKLNLAICED